MTRNEHTKRMEAAFRRALDPESGATECDAAVARALLRVAGESKGRWTGAGVAQAAETLALLYFAHWGKP